MTDEPYRWLEAINNRRDYIREQLKGATPVFAVSRPEGVVLFGVGLGQSKVFELYDRQALAALGHPVDIEKVRQTLIEAAHLEGFTRAPEDVNVRRLLNFSLGPLLKTSFEQIFAAPLMVELLLAEVGPTPASDVLAQVSFDGRQQLALHGIAISHTRAADATAAAAWLTAQLQSTHTLGEVVRYLLAAWTALTTDQAFIAPSGPWRDALTLPDKVLEFALLDRASPVASKYRPLDVAQLA